MNAHQQVTTGYIIRRVCLDPDGRPTTVVPFPRWRSEVVYTRKHKAERVADDLYHRRHIDGLPEGTEYRVEELIPVEWAANVEFQKEIV